MPFYVQKNFLLLKLHHCNEMRNLIFEKAGAVRIIEVRTI